MAYKTCHLCACENLPGDQYPCNICNDKEYYQPKAQTPEAPETRAAWIDVKDEIGAFDPVLASVMVPECIYRGFCPEFKSCGYVNTPQYAERLKEYRNKY